MNSDQSKTFQYAYPRPSVTADVAVVTRDPQPLVLLIQRKNDPYAGAWALPGGYVEEDEPLDQAAARELLEETGVTGLHLTQIGAFGDPGRDPRGWTVTIAYLARVPRDQVMAHAADDAAAVEWFPLDALPPLAFDHAVILQQVRQRIQADDASR